ncbi:MAG: hypothetical protein ACE5F9_00600 [Phycisphaerae bacterium]
MHSRCRQVLNSTGIIWLAAIAAAVFIGCGSVSPLVSLQFANNLIGRGLGGGTAPTTQNGDIQTVCDLDANRRGIRIAVLNEAQQFARMSMTLVASAGLGGFVCDDELSNYFNAGYRETVLDAGNGATIGCDMVQLLGGTRLLTLRLTDTIAQNTGGGTNDIPPIAQPPLNGNSLLPLPELIVLGDEDPIFICSGNSLCTQRGFVYADSASTPIASINASRTQDTVCNANAGTAPEWRLGNPNVNDNEIQPFQYPAGGTLLITVLDRADNANPNVNQVVWAVFDVDGNLIHGERR